MPQGWGRVQLDPAWNHLLPINSNIKQGEMDKSMARVVNTTSLTPEPPVDGVPADAGSPGMITPSTAG